VGKCILTGSREYRYFQVDGSMEKKWDTVTPADLKRLFVSGTYTWYVPLVTKGLTDMNSVTQHTKKSAKHLSQYN